MHRFLAHALLLTATPALAQDAPPKVSASFYAFAYLPGHESIQVPAGSGAFKTVRLSTANIVGPVDCPVIDGKLTLHSTKAPAEGANPAPAVISTAKVPAGMTRAIVILFPPAAKGTEYRSLVINHDATDFPLGIYRLVNLANKPVRGAVGREIVQAKPGGIADLKLTGKPGTVVPVRFEFNEGERWNLLTETRAAIRDDRRWLMFIFEDPATGRMNIRSIPDRTATATRPATTPATPPAP
jgi:hypothetical protein